MNLTDEEQKMLDGAYGKTVQRSMKVLVALGEIYGADHMIPVKNVHSPGVSYRVAGDAGLGYVEDASQDARFRVPVVTLNSIGIDEQDWKKVGFPEEFSCRTAPHLRWLRSLLPGSPILSSARGRALLPAALPHTRCCIVLFLRSSG